jgi:radical SAM superfamily enzyme YgiQ (UPF0313 family)
MKILLVYPEYEDTFWNFKKVLKIIGKRSAYPPLGLLTVAAMIPEDWERKLIDLNCEKLKDEHIKWADYIFISSIIGQKESAKRIINLVKKMGKPVVAGGSLFTIGWEEFPNVDVFVLGEAEEIFPEFLQDLKEGKLKKIYSSENKYPDIKKSPIPAWDLVKLSSYNSVCIQFSRGCPFNCEFCDIDYLNGRNPRLKSKDQFLAELEALYDRGWRGAIFLVDDNFIGNKSELKKEYLPAIIKWQKQRKYPFVLSSQVSINMADDLKLMNLMRDAGFATVFVGIETPDPDGLEECGKFQNKNRDLIGSIKKIQNLGIEVNAGFIIGFDSDKASIFQRQIEFIQKSGIVMAMVSLLNVSPKSRLYQRLNDANRILHTDKNTEPSVLNFIPKMDKDDLIKGYGKVLSTIYSPKCYYARIRTFLSEYKPKKMKTPKVRFYHIKGFFASMWILGLMQEGRHYYWNLIFWSIFKKPGLLPYAFGLPLSLIHFKSFAWTAQYNTYFRES